MIFQTECSEDPFNTFILKCMEWSSACYSPDRMAGMRQSGIAAGVSIWLVSMVTGGGRGRFTAQKETFEDGAVRATMSVPTETNGTRNVAAPQAAD